MDHHPTHSHRVRAGCCYLSAVLLTAFPALFMGPLMPDDPTYPPFALASGCVAARVEAAFLVLVAASCSCLADAAAKGNLTKSATYKCARLTPLATPPCTSANTTASWWRSNTPGLSPMHAHHHRRISAAY